MTNLTKPVRYRSLFDSMFDDLFRGSALVKAPESRIKAPRVNVKEEEGCISVLAEMPGVDEKDLEVTIDNGILLIKSEQKTEKEEENDSGYYKEFSFGGFQRSFRIPDAVDQKKVTAKYKNGILSVTLPKTDNKNSTKKVKIETG